MPELSAMLEVLINDTAALGKQTVVCPNANAGCGIGCTVTSCV
ncbi:MAG: hypothetical protein WDM90_10850 [Ferruginibacter sp.]